MADPTPRFSSKNPNSSNNPALLDFVRDRLTPAVVDEAEVAGRAPELLRASYSAGLYALHAPLHLGGTPPAGAVVPSARQPSDHLYDVVLLQELMQCAAMGLVTEIIGSFGMLLPLLILTREWAATDGPRRDHGLLRGHRADDDTHRRCRLCFSCLLHRSRFHRHRAPPKPQKPRSRGPPGLRTTATLSADGSNYEVNGEKFYISFGIRAD